MFHPSELLSAEVWRNGDKGAFIHFLPDSTFQLHRSCQACVVPPISSLLGVGLHGAVWIVDSRQLSAAGPGLVLHPELWWGHRMRSFCSSFMLFQDSSPIVGFHYATMMAQSCKDHPKDLACCPFFPSLVVLFLLFVDTLFSHYICFFFPYNLALLLLPRE